jgi:hypothetical protein
MAGERVQGVRTASVEESGAPQRLIAARLRQTASAAAPSHFEPMTPFSVEQWLTGDAGHLHRAFDLTTIPTTSDRRHGARIVVALKRAIRRLVFPVLDVQSSLNGANARTVTFLLRQLAAQARSIEALEQQVAELRAHGEAPASEGAKPQRQD